MTKYILSAICLLSIQSARAAEAPVAPAVEPAAQIEEADQSREPATEKSIFETRSFDEEVEKLQALGAYDSTTAGG